MRRLMLALLTGAYLCLSLVISLALWRMGAAPAVGLAAFIGAMGLCFAIHGVIATVLQGAALRIDIETIREAHGILLEQVEKVDARITGLLETVADDAQKRSAELTSEVHQLEIGRASCRERV